MNIYPDVPEGLHADIALLRSTLSEPITNAIAFTQAGVGEVSVQTNTGLFQQVHSAMSDIGSGIDGEALAILFNPFRQAARSDSRSHRAFGLGLALSIKRIDLMGSLIRAKSTPDEGNTCHFTVPLKQGGKI